MMVSFVLSFFPRDVLDEILNLIESVSEDFPSYSYSLSNLVISGNFLHCGVWSLCNQLLLQFSMDHFETMHTCCGYIEDVHVNFCREKNNF